MEPPDGKGAEPGSNRAEKLLTPKANHSSGNKSTCAVSVLPHRDREGWRTAL